MKTIWFELSKKLNDLWLLDNIETEYWYAESWWLHNYKAEIEDRPEMIKTLTLEETIEFLNNNKITFLIENSPYYSWNEKISILIKYINWKLLDFEIEVFSKTLLEATESIITKLLENNLLTK